MEAEGLFVWHDVIDGAGDGEDALIAELGSEAAGVEAGHGSGAAEDLVIFFIGENTGDFFWRIFASIGDPGEGVLEDASGAGFVE